MFDEPGASSVGPPPRNVEPWTHVPDHEVIASRGGPVFCSCGIRPAATDDPVEWRTAHLRGAWPVLVPRLDGEPLGQWMNRVSEEYVAASKVETDLFQEMGGARPIRPGEPYPVMSPEYEAAGDRVQVLEYQLEELRERVIKRMGLDPDA